MKHRLISVALSLLAASAAVEADTGTTGHWNMRALLDGSPIGTHSFTVTGPPEHREMQGRADFTVKLLGVTVYRYQHTATEHWQGDCLGALSASTDDDGKKTVVGLKAGGGGGHLTGPQGSQTLPGCVMSFAYWNPAMLKASKLLDPQSGKYEPVQVTDLGTDTIEAHGHEVEARHYRIDGPKQPIELWYSAAGDWLGLDSMVGKRRLSYRLE